MEQEPGTSKIVETPIYVKLGDNKYEYRCGNCDVTPMRSKYGMDAHIHSVHTKKALLCTCCPFSMYNLDSLNRHERTSTSRTFFVCTHWGDITVGRADSL